jgi:lambda family phage portal protein
MAEERKSAAEQARALRGAYRKAHAPKMSYQRHGASWRLNSLRGWLTALGDANTDIDSNASTLRERSRDLISGGGLARSGPKTLTTNVVGWGIQPKPKIDGEYLGLSDEAREAWERHTLREWNLWAKNQMCDAARQQNFYQMQELAFFSALASGDAFVAFGMKENKRTPYRLVIRILEADRIGTPMSAGSSLIQATADGMIIDGIEIDREGAVKKYWVANRSPLAEANPLTLEYIAVDAFGSETDMPNMLHIVNYERPEQRRGVPFVAPSIEVLKQFDRYINSELAGNLMRSMLALFITSEEDTPKFPMDEAIDPEERISDDDDMQFELAPGIIQKLPAGMKVQTVDPTGSNTAFQSFVETLEQLTGSAMEIPKEVLTKKYESNYTAARSSKLDFWQVVRVYRSHFNDMFNQPIYEAWLSEAVATGRIDAPGFFDDPLMRQAWCGCMWIGASMGHIDPMKEANAAEKRVQLNMTTEEQEAMEYNGNDWSENVIQRRREMAERRDMDGGTQEGETTT